MKNKLVLLLIVALLLPVASVTARDTQTLTVFAAASLTDAFGDIGTAFEAEYPGVEVVFNFAGSSTLATQIAEGAPADVFASANLKQMTVAQDSGRIAEPVQIFAHNRLVVALPNDNPGHVRRLADLARPGVMLVLAAPDVPVRDYTDTMLDLMADSSFYGPEYRQAVLDNLVSEEANVRQVVTKIALGEADAGVVYRSDITPDIAESVRTLRIPTRYNTVAVYPIATTDDTPVPDLAQSFVDFVLSDAGQSILVEWGFISG